MDAFDGTEDLRVIRDPGPTVERSENAGIDVDFSRQAPPGKFRLVSVDTFDGTDSVDGDFDTLEEAREAAAKISAGQDMCMTHIYDDHGNHVEEGGDY
jgi:hypothetical protein